jgi:uncharacterized SAM-binding protein YcdF (DUF218 family)
MQRKIVYWQEYYFKKAKAPGANSSHGKFLGGFDIAQKRSILRGFQNFFQARYVFSRATQAYTKADNQHLGKIDLILAFGSNDLAVPQRAAKRYHQIVKTNPAVKIIASGKGGHLTVPGQLLSEPEADKFRKVLLAEGVPADRIITEPNSTNTGENVQFSYQVLLEMNQKLKAQGKQPWWPKKFLLVQSFFVAKRAGLTFPKQYPGEWEYLISSPPQPPVVENLSERELDFYLAYALREYSIFPKYIYRDNFMLPTQLPSRLADFMVARYLLFKQLDMLSATERRNYFFQDSFVNFYKGLFQGVERNYIAAKMAGENN